VLRLIKNLYAIVNWW